MTAPDYRIEVTVGSHSYSATYPTTPATPDTVTLPLTVGWRIREGEFFPAQAEPLSGSFGIVCDSVAEVADLAIGDDVRITIYSPSTDLDPWQRIGGVVTQLDAQVGQRAGDRAFVRVYFTDSIWLLSQMVVGLGDWPEERVGDRLDRICAEAGLTLNDSLVAEGRGGILAARTGSPTDALSALQQTLKDNMSREAGYTPYVMYGPDVYAYDPSTRTLLLVTFQKRVYSWPATLDADGDLHYRPGVENSLNGNTVTTSGSWSRIAVDATTYVIVDGTNFPINFTPGPGDVPYVRNTSYVDDFTLPGGNPSAGARVNLGRALVPDTDETQAYLWRTDTVRHLSYLDPVPVTGWIDGDGYVSDTFGLGWARIRPTLIEPVDPTLTLDGKPWIAGLLTGATLTIPPGGKFYVDLTLRPEILPPFVPLSGGAATYDDVPPALTYDAINPLLTYRDLNLAGG